MGRNGAAAGRRCILSWLIVAMATSFSGAVPPEDFPQFLVPGHDQLTKSLRDLFWLHYERAGPLIPLWDEWMPMATLWPARGEGPALQAMRGQWAVALASRRMSDEGYVHTQQHD